MRNLYCNFCGLLVVSTNYHLSIKPSIRMLECLILIAGEYLPWELNTIVLAALFRLLQEEKALKFQTGKLAHYSIKYPESLTT